MPTINTKFVQTPAVALYSGVSAGAVSMKITPFPVDLDGIKLTMADFGTIGYFTVDPKISNFEEINSFTGLVDNGDDTGTLTGLTRNLISKYPYNTSGTGKVHGASAVVVFSDNPQLYNKFPAKDNEETITAQWTFNVFPITPTTPLATALVAGMTRLSTAPVSALAPIALGENDVRVPPTAPDARYAPISVVSITTGFERFSLLKNISSGWYEEDGSTKSRTVEAALFAFVMPSQTFTVTIASPGVFTAASHGYVVGDIVSFTTTGALPTGLAVNTLYYVITAGLTTNTFQLSASRGGAAVNTSGTQSGVHTVYWSNHGIGDGSTTFNLPNMSGYGPFGYKVGDENFDVINTPNTYVGEKTHVLLLTELAAHTHTMSGGSAAGGGFVTARGPSVDTNPTSNSTGSAGSDAAHNNMSPYKVGRWLIKN